MGGGQRGPGGLWAELNQEGAEGHFSQPEVGCCCAVGNMGWQVFKTKMRQGRHEPPLVRCLVVSADRFLVLTEWCSFPWRGICVASLPMCGKPFGAIILPLEQPRAMAEAWPATPFSSSCQPRTVSVLESGAPAAGGVGWGAFEPVLVRKRGPASRSLGAGLLVGAYKTLCDMSCSGCKFMSFRANERAGQPLAAGGGLTHS